MREEGGRGGGCEERRVCINVRSHHAIFQLTQERSVSKFKVSLIIF